MNNSDQAIKDIISQVERISTVEKRIGYSDEEILQKRNSLFQSLIDHTTTHYENTIKQEEDFKSEIDLAQIEIARYKKSMGEYASNELVLDPSKSLLANLQEIRTEKQKVEQQYNERLAVVEDLHAQLSDLKDALGECSIYRDVLINPIGSDVSSLAVQALEDEVKNWEQKFIKRKDEVDYGVEQTFSLLVTLGLEAASDKDRLIESYYREKDPDEKANLCQILITKEFRSYLQKRSDDLKEQKRQVEHHKEEMIHSLKQLWSRLHVDPHECEVFLMANRGLTRKEIQKFEDESERLNVLKKERIGEFIEAAREELKTLWDQLFYSDKQRQQFEPAYSTELTDTVLEAHDTEISRLQLELEDSRYIIELIEKHIKLQKEVEEFEATTRDPNRLFGKGQRDPGRLLREEKFRKRIAREMPKVTKELEGSLLEYEDLKGHPFTVHGKPYFDILYETKEQRRPEEKTPKREIPPRKPMTSPRVNRTRKLFFNTPQPNRVKSHVQLQPLETKIDTSESILHKVRAKNTRQQKQVKRSNIFDEDSDDEDTTVRNENVNPIKKKRRATAAAATTNCEESDDSIGLDLGIFDDGPDLSDMSEVEA